MPPIAPPVQVALKLTNADPDSVGKVCSTQDEGSHWNDENVKSVACVSGRRKLARTKKQENASAVFILSLLHVESQEVEVFRYKISALIQGSDCREYCWRMPSSFHSARLIFSLKRSSCLDRHLSQLIPLQPQIGFPNTPPIQFCSIALHQAPRSFHPQKLLNLELFGLRQVSWRSQRLVYS